MFLSRLLVILVAMVFSTGFETGKDIAHRGRSAWVSFGWDRSMLTER
jgi:hypothetical protein